MRRVIAILALALAVILAVQLSPALGQEGQTKIPWTGKLKDGTVIMEENLKRIVDEHIEWLQSEGREGLIADLSKADLTGADLSGANLSGANLSEANLSEANLSKADLYGANLYKADLTGAKLSGADLSGADLRGVGLSGTDLSEANLYRADLSGANLSVDQGSVTMSGAPPEGANLSKASLIAVNLSGADLTGANLSRANLSGANLSKVYFEPKLGTLPDLVTVATAENLSSVQFRAFSHALVELREAFKKAGFRRQEREITYAIKHNERVNLWGHGNSGIVDKAESLFNLLFFELPSDYGMAPGRPLLILIGFIFVFSIPYIAALKVKTPRKRAGIWAVRLPDRVLKTERKDKPIRIMGRLPFHPAPVGRLSKVKYRIFHWSRIVRIGIYFSVLSAFSIGRRELNAGNWISRIQRGEYVLRPTGWVRTVSGIQSVISVYLMALWVLTYFGRPFE